MSHTNEAVMGQVRRAIRASRRRRNLAKTSAIRKPAVFRRARKSSSSDEDDKGQVLKVAVGKNAFMPKRADRGAAGYDLQSSSRETLTLRRGERLLIPTGLRMAIPKGHYGRVAPRSGLALKNGLDVGAGVVDSSYRGKVGVVLFNHSDQDFEIKHGDRIAQLILERISTPVLQQAQKGELGETKRGEGGYGSTGVSVPLPETSV
ncbi:Deoxyuridine 5'-triphosphate nucleotidohydrolase [Mollivirus sibericum]|uniref:dUTPase n=1 Tax=Mollivirus sibericum TaxID=1678078 RepID=UPI0006B2D8D8|nr:dUTPase [Mollivirus sibericum]ALD61831.1 Deoxyuridine 5'-triphosphate nucleotidohydrolase [Mollivirus sibericum]